MAECGPIDVGCGLGNLAGDAIGAAVDSGARDLGETMMGAWDSVMKSFLTSWLDAGMLVSLDGNSVTWLTDQLMVISVFLAVVGIMAGCVWTMVHFRGDKAIRAAHGLFRVFLVTTLGTGLVQVVILAGDGFSGWVLESAGVTVDGYGAVASLGPGTVAALGPGLAIIAGVFGVVATLFQWVIMIIRATLLPLLVAVWPVAAAASMLGGAAEAFSKISTWLLAFLLYKPVAAVIYAFAWKLKSGGDGIGGVINGMLLLLLAIMALPAMMKLLAPATSALGAASGATLAMAGGAAVLSAGVAVGAAVATGGAGAGAAAGTAAGAAAGPAGMTASAAGSRTTAPALSPVPAASSGSAPAGTPAPGSSGEVRSGSPGSAGASGSTAGTGGLSGGAGSGGPAAGSGIRAAARSMGNSVADGARDADGKDVIGG